MCTLSSCGCTPNMPRKPAENSGLQLGLDAGQRRGARPWAPGRARRVVHGRAGGAVLGQRVGLAVDEVGVGPEALDGADGEAAVGGELDLLGGDRARLGEALVDESTLASQSSTM